MSPAAEAIGRIYARVGPAADLAGAVVDEARDPSSPLHAHFEWDDSIAAAKHRHEQARVLIRSVKVQVTTKTGEQIAVRAYVARSDAHPDEVVREGAYVAVVDLERDEQEAVLAAIRRDLETLRRKYRSVSELFERELADVVTAGEARPARAGQG